MIFDNLTQHVSFDSCRWYAEIRGCTKRIQLTTEELFNQKLLQKKLAEATTKIFKPMKANKWDETLANLFETCVVIEDPEDASRTGQFREHIVRWLSEQSLGESKKDLVKRGTYLDKEANIVYFKSPDLFSYLKGKNFNCTVNEVWAWAKDLMGASAQRISVGGTSIRCWSMPAPSIYNAKLEDLL